MRILGGKSGFKTARDLILCAVGLFICLFHVVTVAPTYANLSIPLLLFGGGLAGSPYVLRQDEKKE